MAKTERAEKVIQATNRDYLVFSLKYRPQTFDEIRCQDPVKETLKKAIKHNRVAHSYLFCGPRGVGKTTTARILAKALNCEKGPTITPCGACSACREIASSRSMDVIEIDGASNRQIDDIRELRESIKYSPTNGRYKVYIIDEVHMLTDFAFNALLKTLEEPPRHAKFIFATTAPHNVPSTILSRCQRFDFRKATVEELVTLLKDIARQERFQADEEALFAIARRADGSIRDAETVLDQMCAFRPEGITLSDVEQLLGIVPGDVFFSFADMLLAQNARLLISFVNQVFDQGYNVIEFFTGLANHLRALRAIKFGLSRETLGLSPADLQRMEKQAGQFSLSELSRIIETLVSYEESIKYSLMPRMLLEVMALRMASFPDEARQVRPAASGEPAQQAPVAGEPHRVKSESAGSSCRSKDTAVTSPTQTPRTRSDSVRQSDDEKPSPTVAQAQSLWEQTLTLLHSRSPLLAGVMDNVKVIGIEGSTMTITSPYAPMWNAQELTRELANVEQALSETAGRVITLKVQETVAEKAGKSGKTLLDNFKAVYDCEELR